jgi:hypothetical protein
VDVWEAAHVNGHIHCLCDLQTREEAQLQLRSEIGSPLEAGHS